MTYRGEIDMAKRQLSSKYKDLVDYVNKYKYSKRLADVLSEAIKEGESAFGNCNELWVILNALYVMRLNDSDFSDLTKTIVDIYNDNYELEEPKYYWKFNELTGGFVHDLYLSIRVGYPDTKLSDKNCGLLDPEQYHIMKFTKSNVNQYLMDNTNLTIDNFNPVEEISHD